MGPGVLLEPGEEYGAAIDALGALLGGPVGLTAVLADLNRRGHRSRLVPARAVHRAHTWDRSDRRTTRWWPQGVSTSADADATGLVDGRRVLAVSWYAAGTGDLQGSRVTFVDLDTLAYRHVLVVVPRLADGQVTMEPLRVHAGGLVWYGGHLHVAATRRGFLTCRIADLMRVPDHLGSPAEHPFGVSGSQVGSFGYRYVLPVRRAYRAVAEEGRPGLRCSFLSLDRTSCPPVLLCGEYGRGDQTTRLARFPLDPDTSLPQVRDDGLVRPLSVEDGVRGMQGGCVVDGRWYLSVSTGPRVPGSVLVGYPGRLVRRRWAAPPGPEDLSYWPSTDELWSVSEHPWRRWFYSLRRERLG